MSDEDEEIERNGLIDDIADLGKKNYTEFLEIAPEAFKLSRTITGRGGKPPVVVDISINPGERRFSSQWVKYRTADGYIETDKMQVAYCWTTRRNVAGYFLGWRQIKRKSGRIERDQFVSRKSKKRLAALQTRRADALRKKVKEKACTSSGTTP